MRLLFCCLVVCMSLQAADAQFFNALRNIFAPVANLLGGGGRFADDGTQRPKVIRTKACYQGRMGHWYINHTDTRKFYNHRRHFKTWVNSIEY